VASPSVEEALEPSGRFAHLHGKVLSTTFAIEINSNKKPTSSLRLGYSSNSFLQKIVVDHKPAHQDSTVVHQKPAALFHGTEQDLRHARW